MSTPKKFDEFYAIRVSSGNSYSNKKDFIKSFTERIKGRRQKIKTIKEEVCVIVSFFFSEECLIDIDNLCKTLLDSLQKSEIIENDSQVKSLKAEIIENTFIDGVRVIIRRNKKLS